ncbi:MAG: cytidylate kinase family protein [Thermoplasmata archaeon]|nr:cytidylate kinase family protein [Thermoplasmata archaeon]MCI4359090.1 cytidylate kinase family protein [Thermoplasmata archaeon]
MTGRVVAIGGPPGSGKSTSGRLAAQWLGYEFVSAGELFRAEASRRNVSLEELSQIAERDDSIDRSLDAAVLSLARPGRVLDARLAGALCRQRRIEVDYLWVTAPEAVRVARLAQRDHQDLERCLALTREREASERRRFLAYYAIDLDRERPDLTIDSSRSGADEVAQRIAEFVRARTGGAGA